MNESRTEKILDKGKEMPKSNDTGDFDRAAIQAEDFLRELLAERPLDWDELLAFHLAFYQTAGHKRLGAIYKRLGQEKFNSRR